jgi:hypothetical protein
VQQEEVDRVVGERSRKGGEGRGQSKRGWIRWWVYDWSGERGEITRQKMNTKHPCPNNKLINQHPNNNHPNCNRNHRRRQITHPLMLDEDCTMRDVHDTFPTCIT